MKRHNTTHENENSPTTHLLQDAQELLAATAHVAEEKVVEARKRLNAAIERGKETWNSIQEKTIAGAKATDELVREHPYKSLGIAMGVGVVIGYLLSHRRK